MEKAKECLLIKPRGNKVVVEKIDSASKKGKITYDITVKKETVLITCRVTAIGDEDEHGLIVGEKVLCRQDDFQIFEYEGEEYYIIDSEFVMAYLNV